MSCISQKRPWAPAASRRLGGHLRARVHVVERQVAPDVAEVVAEGHEQLADDGLGLAAVRALVVAVLEQDHGRVVVAAQVVDLGVDVVGEVEQLVGGAAQLARPGRGRDQGDEAEGAPRRQRREDRAGEDADLRLLEQLAVEGDARDEQRDGEADAGDRADAGQARPADRQPLAAEHAAGRQPRGAGDPGGLADDVAHDDAERHRRAQRVAEQPAAEGDARVGRGRRAARSRSSSMGAGGTAGARWPRWPSVSDSCAVRASSGVGCSRKDRKVSLARSRSLRAGG